MRKIFALALLLIFLCMNAWAQPTPTATPPSPESLGIQPPQPTASTTYPPSSESSQALVSTTAASAQGGATRSTQTTATASAYLVVPPGTSAPNKFYVPYSPSTVASCYYGQWLPMWLDIIGSGPLYVYEWYPNGRLVSQYIANIPYPSWKKMWFYGDATGWHTLQYYCNGWSNYIYVYVYSTSSVPGQVPAPKPPTSCNAKIVVSSPYAKGFSVYVDGKYIGGDGKGGDLLDGYYAFTVPGNQQHTIKVLYQGGTYQQTKTYYCGSTYSITLSSSSGYVPVQPIAPPQPTQLPSYPTGPVPTPY